MRTAFLLIVLGFLALSGCNRSAAAEAARPIRIGYFANLTHAQAVLGVSSGEFAKAVVPRKLETQVFNAGPSLIEALLAGEIDVAYVGPGPALNAQLRTRGQGIRVIAGAASNGVLIVARDGSGIKTFQDLRGRTLATPQHGNTQDLAARHFLSRLLNQTDDSNIVPIPNAEQAGMMTRNQIDASWAPEPWGSFLVAKAGAHIVCEEKDLWPDHRFTLTVVVATPEFLSEHADIVENLLKVHRAWTRRLNENPQACIPQLDAGLFALTGKRLPAGVLPAALKRVTFTDEALVPTFQALATWTYEMQFTVQPPNLNGLFDTSILQSLQKQDVSKPSSTKPAAAAQGA